MVYRLGGRAYGLVSPEFHLSFLAFDEGDSVSLLLHVFRRASMHRKLSRALACTQRLRKIVLLLSLNSKTMSNAR